MADLSILIPARNEEFLAKTIEDILEHMRGATEIIAVCDGYWPDPPVNDHELVTLIHRPQSIGQRAATNLACRLSKAKYVMKCDAHCSFATGFDVEMVRAMREVGDDVTMVPIMRNLHAFDWVCPDGHRRYQGPSGPCKECGKPTVKDVVWIAKGNPQSTSYCFDSEPHFQYFREYKDRPGGKGPLSETMSLQGSCWMLTRDKYWELKICDEDFGSWGSQGIEVAVKTWLSGGRVLVNHNTYYAHMFRTQGGDFSFPYSISGRQVAFAKKRAKEVFFNNAWTGQKYPLSWLINKFWPVPGWNEEDKKMLEEAGKEWPQPPPTAPVVAKPAKELTRGLLYYTDCRGEDLVLNTVRKNLSTICNGGYDIVSVSLNQPVDFGRNVVLTGERSVLTMFKQILAGLEASTADIIFFAEHDVLYHPSHFDFTPPRSDVFYYDENRWFVELNSGRALFYHACSTSLLVAYRELLVEHYRKRVERVEREGFTLRLGYEPGNHPFPRGVDHYKRETYFATYPSLDIRHSHNLTPSRWRQDQFRNKSNLHSWTESDVIPGWGKVGQGRINGILEIWGEDEGRTTPSPSTTYSPPAEGD